MQCPIEKFRTGETLFENRRFDENIGLNIRNMTLDRPLCAGAGVGAGAGADVTVLHMTGRAVASCFGVLPVCGMCL